jgi:hypothetical protein
MPNKTRSAARTTTAKGLGHDHQQHRDNLMARHVDGRRCWWCGKPMFKDPKRNPDKMALHADHKRSRSRFGVMRNAANRLLHAKCNIARGDGSKDHLRPALTAQLAAENPLGDLALDWPDPETSTT